jgi:cation diffusion facilitator CzcD-associated flavoprotein CzcO
MPEDCPEGTLIIGGGQAGPALGYHLERLGWEHLILERRL